MASASGVNIVKHPSADQRIKLLNQGISYLYPGPQAPEVSREHAGLSTRTCDVTLIHAAPQPKALETASACFNIAVVQYRCSTYNFSKGTITKTWRIRSL